MRLFDAAESAKVAMSVQGGQGSVVEKELVLVSATGQEVQAQLVLTPELYKQALDEVLLPKQVCADSCPPAPPRM